MKHIGSVINRILDEQGLSKADLARMSGLSTGQVSDICNGVRPSMTLDTLVKVAHGLGIEPGKLLTPEIEDVYDSNYGKVLAWRVADAEFQRKGLSPEKVKKYVEMAMKIEKAMEKN